MAVNKGRQESMSSSAKARIEEGKAGQSAELNVRTLRVEEEKWAHVAWVSASECISNARDAMRCG